MAAYAAVVWTTGDVITETKLDNMVSNDQSEDAHAANGYIANNAVWYKGKDTGGTAQNLIRKSASDMIEIGLGEMAWERLGETTLGGAADVISVASLVARRFLKILVFLIPSGAIDENLTFNNDSSSNYARRSSTNGGGDATDDDASLLAIGSATSATLKYNVIDVVNIAAQEKLVIAHNIDANTAGELNIPTRRELVGKWDNTAAAISRVDIANTQAGSYAAGSKVVVLGHD